MMRKPGARGTRFDTSAGAVRKRFPKDWIEENARPLAPHCKLDLAVAPLRAYIESPAAHQRIACKKREIQQ